MVYIYVNITGGVMGFTPKDIFDFETEYETVRDCATYWSYFNWYFRKELDGRQAKSFSALWHFDKAYAELNKLRRAAHKARRV